jgi:hypothetical protein
MFSTMPVRIKGFFQLVATLPQDAVYLEQHPLLSSLRGAGISSDHDSAFVA